MKKPVVDYREFRLSKINDPQFAHLKLLLGWVVYFALYFLTENLIPVEKCHPVWCKLDDVFQFNEYFVIFYVFWYVLIVLSLGWFALYNTEGFKNLSKYIIITQIVGMICYIIYPTRQDLRPETFENENFFTWVLSIIYSFDTNTGVCPSLHCAYSFGIASVWLKEKQAWGWWKVFVSVVVILICLSTMYVKQHSAVDVIAAIPVGILAEGIVFRKYWKNKFTKGAAEV